ncbi:hypothetical protein JCM30394_36350 [Deferrisoma palaeochoriense]
MGTMFVVDASVVLAVVLNEPEKRTLVRLTRNAGLLAPGCLPWEVGNAFSAMLRRNRLSPPRAIEGIRAFERIPVRYVSTNLEASLRIAADLGI